MQRTVIALSIVALLATSCGADDGDQTTPGSSSTFDASVWVHGSTGLELMFELDVLPGAADAGSNMEVTFVPGKVAEVETAAATAARSGDYDVLVVPSWVGEHLLAEGLLTDPWSRIWADEATVDDLPSALDLSLIIATSTSAVVALGPLDLDTHAVGQADAQALAFVGPAREAEIMQEMEGLIGYFNGVATGMSESVAKELGNDAAWAAASKLIAKRYGAKVAARIAARFNPITGAIITTVDIIKTLDAAIDTSDAMNEAFLSSSATAGDFITEIHSKARDLAQLEGQIIDGTVDGDTAMSEANSLANSGHRLEAGARQSIDGVRDRNDDAADMLEELLERVLDSVDSQHDRATDRAQEAGVTDTSPKIMSSGKLGPTAAELSNSALEFFAEAFTALDPDNPFTHSNGQLIATATEDVDILGVVSLDFTLDAAGSASLFGPGGTYPCGGWNLCMDPSSLPTGAVRLIGMQLAQEPPAKLDADWQYQYGIVFDVDGDATNNYAASSSFPKDTFDATDRWYQVVGGEAYGAPAWEVRVDDATGGSPKAANSNAVIIADGDSLTLVVEQSEVPQGATFRMTSFRHKGDYGMQPPNDFSGDVFPPVGEPLAQFSGFQVP